MQSHEPEKYIDFDHLNSFLGDDMNLILEVFQLFKNQIEIWQKQLVVEADDEIWAAAAHSLKGTANAVGALKLADHCQKAEAYIGDNNRPGHRAQLLQEMEFNIAQVMTEIQRWEYNYNRRKLKGLI